MTYTIRNCELKDLDKLIRLCADHAAYEGANYNPTNKAMHLEKALFSPQPPLSCWVVEANNEVVGYSSFTIDYSTWDAAFYLNLDCLYLEPDYRSLGIGAAIFAKLIPFAKEKGCANIQWHTPIDNVNAIRFYQKMGAGLKEKARFTLDL